jgi:hypothetical protein
MTAMPAGSAVRWAPEDLPIAADELGSWGYVVLEEIVDDVALLRRWPWPVVDPLGRLLWPEGAEHESDDAVVDLDRLKAQLYVPNRIEREPRCGDTFAAPRGAHDHWRGAHTNDLRALLGDAAVYDISADAREAAKIAYQASLGAIQPAVAADEQAQAEVERTLRRRVEERLPPLRISPLPPGAQPVAQQSSTQ